MSKIIFLLLVIGVKILLTKGFMIGFLLLCMAIKGKSLHKNSAEWNDYFLSLGKKEVLHFAISLYLLSSAVSVFICYLLLLWLDFVYPLCLALIIFLASVIYSLCKYKRATKAEIIAGLLEVKRFIREEVSLNDDRQ